MKIIAINGSPRKQWNTHTLLNKCLEGAKETGADTELINLYDIQFKGCTSCFACKLKGGKSYGRCAMNDDLTPVLDMIAEADALILGSPIYFGIVTGEMRSFMERLLFPKMTYTRPPQSLAPRQIPTAFMYTMNLSEQLMKENYGAHIALNASVLKMLYGSSESFFCNETLQFEDYNRVVFSYCDPEERRKRRQEVFPQDCRRAYDLGVRMTQAAGGS